MSNIQNEQLAAAWLHRYYRSAFDRFHSFQERASLIFGDSTPESIAKLSGTLRESDVPWIRRESEGGCDTVGAIAVRKNGRLGTPVLLFGLSSPMEHLALLELWRIRKKKLRIKMLMAHGCVFLVLERLVPGQNGRASGFRLDMAGDPKQTHLLRAMQDAESYSIGLPRTVAAHDILCGRDHVMPWEDILIHTIVNECVI